MAEFDRVKPSQTIMGRQLALAYLPWQAALTCHGFYEFAAKDRFQARPSASA